LINRRIPAVSIVRKVEGNRLPTIVFEDYAGAQAATNHLLQLGHTRIGLIGGDVAYSSNYDRLQGYVKALEEASIQCDQALIKTGSINNEKGSASADALLQLTLPPTALFVASNALMPGVMKTMSRYEVRIPEEISLICFDDLEWFLFSKPPISAVASNHARFAEAAVDLLLNRIQNPAEMDKPPLFMKISFELSLRGSTAPPRRV
jgi:LacI family transcriptional regulator